MKDRSLDALLINVGGTKRGIYQDLSRDFSAVEPPFWAALTAGFIRDKGFGVDILDANAENLTHEETAKIINDANPNLANVIVYGQHPSASTQLMTRVGKLCDEIKKANPEQKILLSGLHPSALPKRTLDEENCDYVCEGEGFRTILGLIENRNSQVIPGLWYKENGEIVHNLRAENIKDLTSELGNVAWDLLPLKEGKYKAHNWQCLDDFAARPNYASLSTSLGCPFTCDFCSIHKTFGERKVRYWDPKWVVGQMATLAEDYGVEVFKIIDETFILNPKHYLAVASGLKERGLGSKINAWAYARVDTTKESHLQELRAGGLKWLSFGFESGNEEILREAHKGNFTKEDMIHISKKVKGAGINIIANYMFGFPKDKMETMRETINLAKEQNCEFANFYCATAWPGSDLYDRVISKNGGAHASWADFAQHAYAFKPLPTNHLSPEQVLKFRDDAFNEYFTNPKYLEMIRDKFGNTAKDHIKKMTEYELKRSILKD